MESILHFDYAAVPILAVVLYTTFMRKATKGISNRLFIGMVVMVTIAVACDIALGFISLMRPLGELGIRFSYFLCYLYFLMNNSLAFVYLFFVFAITRTLYLLKSKFFLSLVVAPYLLFLSIMITNFFNGNVFSIHPLFGYQRGPWIIALYMVSVLYAASGMIHLIRCRSFLKPMTWFSLISMYILSLMAIVAQYYMPNYLVEMYATTFALLMVVLIVQRPEEILDPVLGLPSYKAYKEELFKMVKNGIPTQILAIRFLNAEEIRSYLGEEKYVKYLVNYVMPIMRFAKNEKVNCEVFCEISGSIYIMIEDIQFDVRGVMERAGAFIENETKWIEETGAKFVPRFCLIQYPSDLNSKNEILYLGSEFVHLIPYDRVFNRAGDIVKSRNYLISSNIDSILGRAISDQKFEVYYQPIYSVKEQRFTAAEALIRLHDDIHGYISPAIFIPIAESRGLILPIGDLVLEAVYKLISQLDMEKLGLFYIEINLSIAQCIQKDLPDKIKALEEKYGVSSKHINFEITETMYEDLSTVIDTNIRQLRDMGYSISLDDYGVGYSNIHRILKLPLKIVKIDKSLVDGIATSSGMSIFKNTVSMLKDINLELVVEGVETKDTLDRILEMDCDYVQGFYYSKPIPEAEFINFLRERNFQL